MLKRELTIDLNIVEMLVVDQEAVLAICCHLEVSGYKDG